MILMVFLLGNYDQTFQLDGVRTGLNQLEKALQDMSEIKVKMPTSKR